MELIGSPLMTEYCTCGGKCPGYLSLRDPLNTFVCGLCMKPSLLVWLASERFCEECGCSIYSLWELICSPCQTAILELAADLSAQGVPPQDQPETAQSCHSGAWMSWSERVEMTRREPYVYLER